MSMRGAQHIRGTVHWISETGDIRIVPDVRYPTIHEMNEFVMGNTEHITVLFKNARTSMLVNEFGRRLWTDRNPAATEIYFAASRARGIDPEDAEQAEQELQKMAASMGVKSVDIIRLDNSDEMATAPGIYGPAIVLEGFES